MVVKKTWIACSYRRQAAWNIRNCLAVSPIACTVVLIRCRCWEEFLMAQRGRTLRIRQRRKCLTDTSFILHRFQGKVWKGHECQCQVLSAAKSLQAGLIAQSQDHIM